MKQFIMILIAIAVLIPGVCFAAGTEYAAPAVGDEIAGFRVTSLDTFEPLNADLVYMEHIKTGAQVLWIANDDTERAFTIGFNTATYDGKGVPHVFEHAALAGSERYPDPNLFFNIISSTYHTYLNASTYPVCTVYPASSLSEEQLLKTMDVYLAGVYEPIVLTEINDMRREAYRYEMEDADSPLTLTGIVYSEMQASYNANEEYFAMMQAMYPGSYYASVSGGIPGEIETMTHEDIINFHNTYYHPSNSYIVLYGDLNLETFLSEIDTQYLSAYERKEVVLDDSGYEPFTGFSTVEKEYAVSGTSPERTNLYYAIDLNDLPEDLKKMGSIAVVLLDSDISPLTDLMIERYPEGSFSAAFDTEAPHTMLYFTLENATEDDCGTFVDSVKEGLALILESGYDPAFLDAIVTNVDISMRMQREGSNIGVNIAQNAVVSAACGSFDIHSYFDDTNYVLDNLDTFIQGSGPIDFVQAAADAPDSRLIITRSVPGLMEERSAQQEQALTDRRAAMTDEAVAETVAQTKEFAEWMETNSQISLIDDVRVVTANELPIEVTETNAADETIDGMRVISSEIEMSDPVSVTMYFDVSHIPVDQLPKLNFTTELIVGVMDTDIYSYIDTTAIMYKYMMSGSVTTIDKFGSNEYSPVYEFSFTCLREDLPEAFAAAEDILMHSRVLDRDYLRYYVNAIYDATKYGGAENAYAIAQSYAGAAVNPSALYDYYLSNMPYYTYQEELIAMSDGEFAAEIDADLELFSTVMNRNGFVMTVVGNAESIAAAKEMGLAFYNTLDDTVLESVDYANELVPLPSTIAAAVDIDSNYNIAEINMYDEGIEFNAKMRAVDKLIYDSYLIPEMRYKNGVYSPLNETNRTNSIIIAYRDPDLTTTFDTVIPSIAEYLRTTPFTQETLDGYIVANFSTYALQGGPIGRANTAISDVLRGCNTSQIKRECMEDLRSLTTADISEMTAVYDALVNSGVHVTVGNPAAIAAAGDAYEMVVDWYIQ